MEHNQRPIELNHHPARTEQQPIHTQATAKAVWQLIQPLQAGSKEHSMYALEGFSPIMIDEGYLRSIAIETPIAQATAEKLQLGSEKFRRLYESRGLTPDQYFTTADIPLHDPLEVHNYTGMCPTFVYELTPSKGACSIACQYCLVTDGNHCQPTVVWSNYAEYIGRILEERKDESAFYYFSPKTEALSEPHLQTGIAHGILRTFIEHFNRHPDSRARMFMATKAGPKHLSYQHEGDSILDLLRKLAGKIQVNGSIGIMPSALRDVLEPNAASIDDRLTALQMCQQEGVLAESVLAQPLLLPYMREGMLQDYFQKLHAAGVRNIKPEFLTVDVSNLVSLAQFVHHFNPELMKEFLEVYVHPENQNHVKQRSRLAPDRGSSIQMLKKLQEYATKFDMSISICSWVKSQLVPLEPSLAAIDQSSREHGYRCLGYQTRLLEVSSLEAKNTDADIQYPDFWLT